MIKKSKEENFIKEMLNLLKNIGCKMRVKLEPETAFIGRKFAYIFLVVIFGLNAITFTWYFFFSKIN